jgi:hypothetical protein
VSEARVQPILSGSAVTAAGFASATAAVVTSRFGVAGTILGAALTAMIITGVSAILRSYLESMSGRVRGMSGSIRTRRRGRERSPVSKAGFMSRLRASFASLNWFSHLPKRPRRSIILKGLLGSVVALVIGMSVVTVAEAGIGTNLSCALWKECGGTTLAAGATGASSGGTTISKVGQAFDAQPEATRTDFSDGSGGGIFQGDGSFQEAPQPADPVDKDQGAWPWGEESQDEPGANPSYEDPQPGGLWDDGSEAPPEEQPAPVEEEPVVVEDPAALDPAVDPASESEQAAPPEQ